jgi:DNA-binding response OmpR family regulator
MFVAVYPHSPSVALIEGLIGAGFRPVPVTDASDVVDQEPAEGWAAIVVELGDDPQAAVAVSRRAKRSLGIPSLVVASRLQTSHLDDGEDFDDFVLSPIDADELGLRLRRLGSTGPDLSETLEFKDLTLNLATYQATIAEAPVDLTFMEYELLHFFVTHAGRVWSREQLLQRVWGYDYFGGARTVDVHVRRLRAKLGEERAGWITTVRSVGYRFG